MQNAKLRQQHLVAILNLNEAIKKSDTNRVYSYLSGALGIEKKNLTIKKFNLETTCLTIKYLRKYIDSINAERDAHASYDYDMWDHSDFCDY